MPGVAPQASGGRLRKSARLPQRYVNVPRRRRPDREGAAGPSRPVRAVLMTVRASRRLVVRASVVTTAAVLVLGACGSGRNAKSEAALEAANKATDYLGGLGTDYGRATAP